jgi:hypothetical protein
MTRIRSTSAAFAARLAHRHARRAIRRGIHLPLVAAARTLTNHVMHRHTRFGDVIQSRLSLVLHLHSTLITGSAARPRQQATESPANRRAGLPTVAAPPRRASSIAERLALRVMRVEASPSLRSAVPVVTNPRSDTSTNGDASWRAATAMTLPRRREDSSRRQENAITSATRVDQATSTDDRGVRTTRPERTRRDDAAPALPDREIERLAGRVIDSIDRRIAAQRERLGRF